MDDDLLLSLQQDQLQAAGLQDVAISMQPPAMPPVERGDRADAFLLRLDEDGVPDRIRVANDWSQRVRPEDIGQAVLEAYGGAVGAYMHAWAQHLERSNWEERMRRSATGISDQAPKARPTEREAPPPSMDEIAESAIAALRTAVTPPSVDADERETTRVNAARRAVITLPQGRMTACQVDARWAKRQSSQSLAGALGRALKRAREELRQRKQAEEAARAAQAERAQALFGDALQILKNPQRFSGT